MNEKQEPNGTEVPSTSLLAEAAFDTERCYLLAMMVCSPQHHDEQMRKDAKSEAHAIIVKWKNRVSANKHLSGPEPAAGDGYARKDGSR